MAMCGLHITNIARRRQSLGMVGYHSKTLKGVYQAVTRSYVQVIGPKDVPDRVSRRERCLTSRNCQAVQVRTAPSWSQGDIIIERLMSSADLWHYIDVQSRESGTIPASCLKFVFKGHPPTPPSSSSRMSASNTVDQSTSTVVSAQDPKDMTKVHVPPLSLQFKGVSASMPDLQSTVDSLPDSPQIPAAVLPTKNIPNRLLDSDRTTLFEEPNTTKLTSCRCPTLTEMHTWPATSVSCAHPSRSRSPRVIDAESFLGAQQRHKRQGETATTDEVIPMKPLSREPA